MKRGEIYITDLSDPFGHEQGGQRPVLIVQNDVGNRYAPTTICVPLTKQNKKNLPTHFRCFRGIALCEQIRIIDKKRLLFKCGELTDKEMKEIDKCLKISIGL